MLLVHNMLNIFQATTLSSLYTHMMMMMIYQLVPFYAVIQQGLFYKVSPLLEAVRVFKVVFVYGRNVLNIAGFAEMYYFKFSVETTAFLIIKPIS